MKLDELEWRYFSDWWDKATVRNLKIYRCTSDVPLELSRIAPPAKAGTYIIKVLSGTKEVYADLDPCTAQCLLLSLLEPSNHDTT